MDGKPLLRGSSWIDATLRQQGLAAHRSRSEEHTSELQSRQYLVCRLLLEKKETSTSWCAALASSRRPCTAWPEPVNTATTRPATVQLPCPTPTRQSRPAASNRSSISITSY